jgi:hypothetical protein
VLRAMAEKLIPGISYATRIAILQQTDFDMDGLAGSLREGASLGSASSQGRTVLQQVMAGDERRNEITRKISGVYILFHFTWWIYVTDGGA